jgi:tRNA G18 (ribose-2'-O)-methylase SpoU
MSDEERRRAASAVTEVGVGPHPEPWPEDPRLDPELLAKGDRRNVIDRFRYWRVEAIRDELDARRFEYHVAIENFQHDFNIGTVLRNANAFGAARVHIVGARRFDRRGAMCTDRYLHVDHHPTVDRFAHAMEALSLSVLGVDLLPGSIPIERASLPRRCVLVFGQESIGLSDEMRRVCATLLSITQFGSTRSINAGVASGIAMHRWISEHVFNEASPRPTARREP